MAEEGWLTDVRTSYDTVAESYTAMLRDELAHRPYDRAVLGLFAELVAGGPVADVGCGPGRVTAHLRDLGVDAVGVDLSPGMIAMARREHPGLRFEVGSMTRLAFGDGSLAGLLAWYSVIHVPDEVLPAVLAGFARVLRPGGVALLAFHAGDERRHKTEGYGGHPMSLDVHLRPPDRMADLLAAAGLPVRARLVWEPDGTVGVPQAFLLARKD